MQRNVVVTAGKGSAEPALGLFVVHVTEPGEGIGQVHVEAFFKLIVDPRGQAPGFAHGVVHGAVLVVDRRAVIAQAHVPVQLWINLILGAYRGVPSVLVLAVDGTVSTSKGQAGACKLAVPALAVALSRSAASPQSHGAAQPGE